MRIVVLEHLTSMPRAITPLEREGRAMRDAIAADLRALPRVTVTVLDRADVPRGSTRDESFRRMLRRADAGLVIAPEDGGVLEGLVRLVEEAGRLPIGPGSAAVRLAADKAATARLLRAAGVPAPRSAVIRMAVARRWLARRRLPFVLKPRDGCGCSGVAMVRRRSEIPAAIAAVRSATERDDLLWQERVAGVDASVAVIAAAPGTPRRFLAIGPCLQRIRRGAVFSYRGGEAPLSHPRAAEARAAACRAVAALDAVAGGARGWLGVDLVIDAGGIHVIEINPRLTTSYVALRRIARPHPAALMLRAAAGCRLPGYGLPGSGLPARVALRGRCRFRTDGTVEFEAGAGEPALPHPEAAWRRSGAGTSAASI